MGNEQSWATRVRVR